MTQAVCENFEIILPSDDMKEQVGPLITCNVEELPEGILGKATGYRWTEDGCVVEGEEVSCRFPFKGEEVPEEVRTFCQSRATLWFYTLSEAGIVEQRHLPRVA